MSFNTPIALIIFNRPYNTSKVIDILRKVKPSLIFVIADGPRDGILSDQKLCSEARNQINQIDWPCELRHRFLDVNLGCGHGPAKGLDWVFSQVESCIILEDDCAPTYSFFDFCQEMLERYKNNEKIMMISGNNHLLGKKTIEDSYCYSIHTQTHGWATWRRAWKQYDFFMLDWLEFRSLEWLTNYLGDKSYARGWLKTFDTVYREVSNDPRCSYWDFQWTYALWKNHGLTVIPRVNLVTNIGYGDDATHPTPDNHPLANLPTSDIAFPLRHPEKVIRDIDVDHILSQVVYGNIPFTKRFFNKILRTLNFGR